MTWGVDEMSAKPEDVLEAMAKSGASKVWDEPTTLDKAVIKNILHAAIKAAAAHGWKLVPRERTDEMVRAWSSGICGVTGQADWERQYDAVPSLIEDGE